MSGYLIASDGSSRPAGPTTVRRLLDEDRLLWLDLHLPGKEELALLTEVLAAGVLLVLFRRPGWM